ncbi:MAG TPA: ABC transporter permease subunit [Trueperaceae bacterium]|nr:ABC transporter permease subunit [Trueperaceae bacterium]
MSDRRAVDGVVTRPARLSDEARGALWLLVLTVLGVGLAFAAVALQRQAQGTAGALFWLALGAGLTAAVVGMSRLSLLTPDREPDAGSAALMGTLQRYAPVATVPFVLLLAWEGLVVGFRVPPGIFPSVAGIGQALVRTWPVLVADAYLTFVREVLFGFLVGLLLGFLTGTAIAFSAFMRRGFLPLATAFGAVPIVGLAPVLGRALGVDWESKAAVGVIVTFFPVVLNTVQGLVSVEPLKLELLRSYAARPLQGFLALRLPNALPYVFTSLKVAIVLTVVSVIVAEFLIPGPPTGLGQRISLSAHRGQFDVVFAAILVSSLLSMLLYWTLQLLERWLLAWHPSSRGG